MCYFNSFITLKMLKLEKKIQRENKKKTKETGSSDVKQ